MWIGKSIHFEVQGKSILNGVDVTVRPGSILAVLGPNGAGKSTLFKILTGELSPTSGSVELEHLAVSAWNPLELALRRASMGQHPEIFFPISVHEVVLLGRSPHFGWQETARDLQIAQTALQKVGMENFADRLFPSLSGGEKQRVQLARALAQIENGNGRLDGKFLFLDEPVASLDLKHQHDVFVVARELANRGVGVLIVLHDLNLALNYADEILLLHHGRVAAGGSPEAALTDDILQNVFEVFITIEKNTEGRPVFIRHTPLPAASIF